MCDRLVASHIHHFRRWSNFYNKADPFFVRTRPCFKVTLCNSLLLTHFSLIKSHSIRSHPSHTYPNPNLNLTFPYSNSDPLRTTSSDFSPEISIMVSIMVYKKRFHRTWHNYHWGAFWLFLFVDSIANIGRSHPLYHRRVTVDCTKYACSTIVFPCTAEYISCFNFVLWLCESIHISLFDTHSH